MASVQDRWYADVPTEAGTTARVRTRFYETKVHRWRAHYRTPDGKQRNKTFARKVDAERFLTTVESSKLTGTFVDPSRSRVTFGEMAKKWSASKVGLKESTRARYDSALNTHVLPRWKHVPLSGVHHEQIQEWIVELCASGMSGAAVHKVVGVMSGVLELAVRARRLPANPAANLELPHSKSRRKRYLTADQVELMAEAARALPSTRPRLASNASFDQYRLVVYVLAYCGLRWSEVAALRTHSVDLVKGRITVAAAVVEVDHIGLVWGTPKSHEARWVPIPQFLLSDLREHTATRSTDDLLFT